MSKRNKHRRLKIGWENSTGFVDLKKQLAILSENKRKIKDDRSLYYDQELDVFDIEQYYRGAEAMDLSGLALFYKFHHLTQQNHTNKIPYFLSKDLYLYTWVDLYPDGSAKSIYSSEKKDPETLILEDNEKIRLRYDEFRLHSHKLQQFGFRTLKELKAFEANFKMNTEHIVPQSWFGAAEPMKGDLHHLFVCQPACNITRSNFPYADFDFYTPESAQEPLRNNCGISLDNQFEPEHGKGASARAMLYFLLRYPKKVKKEYVVQVDLSLLTRWNLEFPPSLYEKHRNQAIYYTQGNRNPFIDFPDLAGKISFPF